MGRMEWTVSGHWTDIGRSASIGFSFGSDKSNVGQAGGLTALTGGYMMDLVFST